MKIDYKKIETVIEMLTNDPNVKVTGIDKEAFYMSAELVYVLKAMLVEGVSIISKVEKPTIYIAMLTAQLKILQVVDEVFNESMQTHSEILDFVEYCSYYMQMKEAKKVNQKNDHTIN